MSPPAEQVRPALLMSFFLLMLGSCGAARSHNNLSQKAPPPMATAPADTGDPEADAQAEALQAEMRDLMERLWESPHRRPIAAVGIGVSVMLILAAFGISFRIRGALWWIRNAVAANVLWAVADCAHAIHRALGTLEGPILGGGERDPPPSSDAALQVAIIFIALTGLATLLSIGLHIYVAWRCHRPDVRGYLASRESS